MSSNNSETYKLLELSDDSESDLNLPELITTPRKRKVRRRKKSRNRSVNIKQPSHSICNIRVVSVSIAAVLLTTWIVTLTWLAFVLHKEVQRLDSTVKGVVTSSQGVTDALQDCHTKSKSLQGNQTLILSQIATLKSQLENFTKEMSNMQTGLSKLQAKFNNVPEYVNVPQNLKDMSESIANLGSQIKDITTTVGSIKESKDKLETTSNTLVQNVTSLRQSVLRLENQIQVPVTINSKNNAEVEDMLKAIDGIKNNISTINNTLSNNIQWLRDDIQKSNKNIENISNIGQNVSARLTTLEGICGKTASDQINLTTSVKNIMEQFNSLSDQVQSHTTQLSNLLTLQTQLHDLNQTNSELLSTVHMLNQSIGLNRATEPPPVLPTTIHENADTNNNNNDEDVVKVKTNAANPSTTVKPVPEMAKVVNPTLKPAILSTT